VQDHLLAQWGAFTFLSSCCGLLELALWKLLDWLLWSSTFAAEISRPNPVWFIFMASSERDNLHDQSTHERGTPASDYKCCLHARTHSSC
jgi:hypothetical protein